jgi:hypothetical protein
VGPFARLIAHHTDGLTLAVEAAVALLLVLLFGGIWLRERQRRLRKRGGAEMRE